MSSTHDTSNNSTGTESTDTVSASTFFIAASLVPVIGICIALTLSFINRHIKHLSRRSTQPKYRQEAARVKPISAEDFHQWQAQQPQPLIPLVTIHNHNAAPPLATNAANTATTAGDTEVDDTDNTAAVTNIRVTPLAYSGDDNDDSDEVEITNADERDEKSPTHDDPLRLTHDITDTHSPTERRQTLPTRSVSFDVSTPVPALSSYSQVSTQPTEGQDQWNDDDLIDTANAIYA